MGEGRRGSVTRGPPHLGLTFAQRCLLCGSHMVSCNFLAPVIHCEWANSAAVADLRKSSLSAAYGALQWHKISHFCRPITHFCGFRKWGKKGFSSLSPVYASGDLSTCLRNCSCFCFCLFVCLFVFGRPWYLVGAWRTVFWKWPCQQQLTLMNHKTATALLLKIIVINNLLHY